MVKTFLLIQRDAWPQMRTPAPRFLLPRPSDLQAIKLQRHPQGPITGFPTRAYHRAALQARPRVLRSPEALIPTAPTVFMTENTAIQAEISLASTSTMSTAKL